MSTNSFPNIQLCNLSLMANIKLWIGIISIWYYGFYRSLLVIIEDQFEVVFAWGKLAFFCMIKALDESFWYVNNGQFILYYPFDLKFYMVDHIDIVPINSLLFVPDAARWICTVFDFVYMMWYWMSCNFIS